MEPLASELDGYPYWHAARADLLRRLARWTEAEEAYRRAVALVGTAPERAFLEQRLAEVRLAGRAGRASPGR